MKDEQDQKMTPPHSAKPVIDMHNETPISSRCERLKKVLSVESPAIMFEWIVFPVVLHMFGFVDVRLSHYRLVIHEQSLNNTSKSSSFVAARRRPRCLECLKRWIVSCIWHRLRSGGILGGSKQSSMYLRSFSVWYFWWPIEVIILTITVLNVKGCDLRRASAFAESLATSF